MFGLSDSLCRQYSQYLIRSARTGSLKKYLRSKREGRLTIPGSRRSTARVRQEQVGEVDEGGGRLTVVGTSDHQDAVIAFQAVDFIQEVGAHLIRDETVEVLEDEQAWGSLAGFEENLAD